MEEPTRDPDAMPAPLRTEEPRALKEVAPRRGRLKIFFGCAAGVGKTYAMLEMARAQMNQHVDVVVGLIEAHGRTDTKSLLEGMVILPRKRIKHHAATLEEFDFDEALRRKPALCVVDELAHTNCHGLRHAKRWQDVEELLNAGIDVCTTLNVQHLESLNDVMAQITGLRVAETVPDHLFNKADEVELVDLSPDELRDRFQQGKVHVPDQAAQAAENFFRKSNLIALREIALRKMADRMNGDGQMARQGRATTRIRSTRERLLACIGPGLTATKVIRATRNLAASLNAEWTVVATEGSSSGKWAEKERRRLHTHLELAQSLGAKTDILLGHDVAGGSSITPATKT